MPFAEHPLAESNPLTGRFRSFARVQTPTTGRTLARWAAALGLLALAAGFLPWTQNIRSTGTLTTLRPQDRPQTVPSTIAGRIDRWRVREGQHVRRGDTLVDLVEVKEKYFDPQLVQRTREQLEAKIASLSENKAKNAALTDQQVALRAGLQVSLSKARNYVEQSRLKVNSDEADLVAVRNDYTIAQRQQQRQEELYKQGLKSLTELEQRRLKFQEATAKLQSAENKLEASRQALRNAQLELASLSAEYQDKLAKSESDRRSVTTYQFDTEGQIAKMRNELANLSIRSGYYQITAPQDGYVVRALKEGLGEIVKEGEPIVTVMPDAPALAAELYVQPMDIPLLSVGRKVRLQFDGWPALVFSGWPGTSFGTFGGVVAVIDNIDSQGQYRVLVTPDPDQEPWPKPLRVGSGVYGWALLDDVPIWYELWRQVNGFPPDFVGAPAGKDGKEGKAGKKEKKAEASAEEEAK
ncbi:HlyD family efflux transporter periplasmic adaptor subunit [Hymenobacter lutimineralis]|uniref:HlyD family efflux transporter periplasmic adaptor subunit n=1 Tax=Hymenobacter lutimineralis TaxID=2606448 RepID=A0A5D6UZ49_9BACT|nr:MULTISPECIES: HlyD family efflux transporter periplasmic adaptor subunit [Hymenobacter]QIX59753.1 HlyD family efflux transporter periplasmic adaptor subunit [Hymenobacter sp. BT18]TYZ08315.1 HlyD family efflux transporter periplasmic adaptor subunit [Hymenobacter lutimineralis]